jgi:hypothetical protein
LFVEKRRKGVLDNSQTPKLLKIPYYLSPAWLRIDPNFAPLTGHPRFEKIIS